MTVQLLKSGRGAPCFNAAGRKDCHPFRPLFSSGKTSERLIQIAIDAEALVRHFLRAKCFPQIDAGILSMRVLHGHLTEGQFDDARGVMFIAHHF